MLQEVHHQRPAEAKFIEFFQNHIPIPLSECLLKSSSIFEEVCLDVGFFFDGMIRFEHSMLFAELEHQLHHFLPTHRLFHFTNCNQKCGIIRTTISLLLGEEKEMITNRTAGVARVVCGVTNPPANRFITSGYVTRLMRLKSTASAEPSNKQSANQEYETFKKSIPAFSMASHNIFLEKYSKTLTEDSDA